MKFNIEKRELQSLATRAASVVERRNAIPILANVKLVVNGDTITTTTTDLDIQVEARGYVTASVDGATTVDAKLFSDIAKGVPDGALVSFELKDDYLHVKAGRSKFKLATLPASDFPAIASDSFDSALDIDAESFKHLLDKTSWAASTEETRYYLRGVALQQREGKMTAVATDGHRLAKYELPNETQFPDVIVPSKAVAEFAKSLDAGGVVRLSISDTKVRLDVDGGSITSKVIDGTFPDWTRVIPRQADNSVTASSVELKDAIARVVLVSSERTRAVKLSVSDSALAISVHDQIGHSADEAVDVEQAGADVVFGLNSKYGLDALNRADKGDVTLYYSGSGDPIRVEYGADPNLVAVLMPLRIN